LTWLELDATLLLTKESTMHTVSKISSA